MSEFSENGLPLIRCRPFRSSSSARQGGSELLVVKKKIRCCLACRVRIATRDVAMALSKCLRLVLKVVSFSSLFIFGDHGVRMDRNPVLASPPAQADQPRVQPRMECPRVGPVNERDELYCRIGAICHLHNTPDFLLTICVKAH